MSIQEAIIFNNTAVLDLHQGKLTEGVQSLRRAIALLRDLSEPQQSVTDQRIHGVSPTASQTSHITQAQTPTHSDHERQHESMSLEHERDQLLLPAIRLVQVECPTVLDRDVHNFVLFNHAIFLDSNVSEEDHEMVCACVLFNMALSHHIKGLNPSPPRRDTLINKALQLYRIVLRILERLPQDASPSSELLTLCTLNNAAHIHSISFDHDSVSKHADAMHEILSKAGAGRNDNQVLSYFAMNTIFYKENHHVAPAA